MLDYLILDKKPIVKSVKNNEYIQYKDLLTPGYKGNFVPGGRMVFVEKYYVARPDLISLAIYGNDKYADIICKVNGISNPFELNEGMIIYTPDISDIEKMFGYSTPESDILDNFKELNFKNTFKSYSSEYVPESNNEETIEKKKSNLQKYKNERRTPGEQTINDNNYIIDRSMGLVIY